ncbi:hypothetical protein TrVFT333_003662 [Trichoderma virens FT-333]|nr:hypothetical protein TrVFT333_003662 [Trichoderma virens FT-333]
MRQEQHTMRSFRCEPVVGKGALEIKAQPRGAVIGGTGALCTAKIDATGGVAWEPPSSARQLIQWPKESQANDQLPHPERGDCFHLAHPTKDFLESGCDAAACDVEVQGFASRSSTLMTSTGL